MRQRLAWIYDGGTVKWPRALLVALVLAVVVGIGFFSLTSATAFDPYNPTWDGTSEFRDHVVDDAETAMTVGTETDQYEETIPDETMAVVVAPDEHYDPTAAERVSDFVDAGGTLVVLENFGTAGPALLESVGANASIDGRLVRDEHNHAEAPTMPIASEVENHTLTAGVDQLTLNYASVVEPNNATVLVRTSNLTYLTETEESELEDETELASYPVATAENQGNGTVVVVSDPSIAINVMFEYPDNAEFLQRLAAERDTVLLDLSHTGGLPPLTTALHTIRESWLLQTLVGGLGILGIAFASTAPRRTRAARVIRPVISRIPGVFPVEQHRRGGQSQRPPDERPLTSMTDDELAAYLRQQHPEWDEKRIQRLSGSLPRDVQQSLNRPGRKER